VTYDEQPYTALICRLIVSTPGRNLCTWINTHLLIPEGWKAELAWFDEP